MGWDMSFKRVDNVRPYDSNREPPRLAAENKKCTHLRRVLGQLGLHPDAQSAHALHGLLARDGLVLRTWRRRVGGIDYAYLDGADGIRDPVVNAVR